MKNKSALNNDDTKFDKESMNLDSKTNQALAPQRMSYDLNNDQEVEQHYGLSHRQGTPILCNDRSDLQNIFSIYANQAKELECDYELLDKSFHNMRLDWDDDVSQMGAEAESQLIGLWHNIETSQRQFYKITNDIQCSEIEADSLEHDITFERQLSQWSIERLETLERQHLSSLEELHQLDSTVDQKREELNALKTELSKNKEEIGQLRSELLKQNYIRNCSEMELRTLRALQQSLLTAYNVKSIEYNNILGCLVEPTQFYRSELTRVIGKIRRDFQTLNQLQLDEVERHMSDCLVDTRDMLNYHTDDDIETNSTPLIEKIKQMNEMRGQLNRDRSSLIAFEHDLRNQLKEESNSRRVSNEHCSYEIEHLQRQIAEMRTNISTVNDQIMSLKMESNICRTLLDHNKTSDLKYHHTINRLNFLNFDNEQNNDQNSTISKESRDNGNTLLIVENDNNQSQRLITSDELIYKNDEKLERHQSINENFPDEQSNKIQYFSSSKMMNEAYSSADNIENSQVEDNSQQSIDLSIDESRMRQSPSNEHEIQKCSISTQENNQSNLINLQLQDNQFNSEMIMSYNHAKDCLCLMNNAEDVASFCLICICQLTDDDCCKEVINFDSLVKLKSKAHVYIYPSKKECSSNLISSESSDDMILYADSISTFNPADTRIQAILHKTTGEILRLNELRQVI